MESKYKIRNIDSPLSLEEYDLLPKNPITVILDNLRSAYNVGSIFRTSDAARIEKVIPCGYSACPPHIKLEKTALGTDKFVQSDHFDSTVDAVKAVQKAGTKVIAVETAENVPIYNKFEYPNPVCLVLGNEALGISDEVMNEVDDVVQIPLFGYKNSLNVVCAYSVVVFEILRQWNR